MSPLENELKSAMGRREAPAGFTDRVMARIPPPKRRAWSHSWFAAAAAALIAIFGSGAYEYQKAERMRREGERAKAELVMALEIASEKLQHTRVKVLKSSEDRI